MSAIYDGVILSNAASANEQMNEMPIATTTNKISSSTLVGLGFAKASAASTDCGSNRVRNSVINADNVASRFITKRHILRRIIPK